LSDFENFSPFLREDNDDEFKPRTCHLAISVPAMESECNFADYRLEYARTISRGLVRKRGSFHLGIRSIDRYPRKMGAQEVPTANDDQTSRNA
jgi:hypothetical protein